MDETGPAASGLRARRFLDTDPGLIERFGDPFRPLEPECRVVQFGRPLTASQLARAGELMAARLDVQLYVYGAAATNVDFLRHFPTLRRLHLALYDLAEIDGFAHLPGEFEALTFGATRKPVSLAFLERFANLRRLFLVGHRKGIEVVGRLPTLEGLGLSGITLPGLDLFSPLTRLAKVSLFLGGTTNLAALPGLPALAELHIMRVTRLADLSVLGELTGLRALRLDWMRNVTALPGLGGLRHLETVELDTMKGLRDLSPVAAAPALRRLTIRAMPQLSAEDFRCLLAHPSLETLYAHTGRQRVNDAVKAMFPGIAR